MTDGLALAIGILDLVGRILGFAATILVYVLAWKIARMWFASLNPVLSRNGVPQGRYFLRRLFCSHRRGYARVKSPYGYTYTGCMRCGANVNEGRRFEERV